MAGVYYAATELEARRVRRGAGRRGRWRQLRRAGRHVPRREGLLGVRRRAPTAGRDDVDLPRRPHRGPPPRPGPRRHHGHRPARRADARAGHASAGRTAQVDVDVHGAVLVHRRRTQQRLARRRRRRRARLRAHRPRPRRRRRSATRGRAIGRRPLPYETSRPGLFAVGDLRSGSTKRVAAAVGEGSAAIRSVHEHLAPRRSTPRSSTPSRWSPSTAVAQRGPRCRSGRAGDEWDRWSPGLEEQLGPGRIRSTRIEAEADDGALAGWHLYALPPRG